MLDINDIHVYYGQFQALAGISLNVKEGEIVAILGSNGAGKTTTMNAVSGMNPLTSGTIRFCGEDISNWPVHKRVQAGIVQVPEGRKLFPYMTVTDNLLLGSYLPDARKVRARNLERCYDLFPKLAERGKQLAGSLSGGEQQMVAIARGLMQNPKLLMFDEPSLGLAPVVIDGILDTIQTINKEGITILLVEQNVMAALEIAHRGYVIETGHNVVAGSASELSANEEIRRAYMGV